MKNGKHLIRGFIIIRIVISFKGLQNLWLRPSLKDRQFEFCSFLNVITSRVHGELNRGFNKGGRVGLKKGGDGKWIQKVNKSIKARGTEGKCTPITKPGCTGRAKALAKTFKKMAAKRKGS